MYSWGSRVYHICVRGVPLYEDWIMKEKAGGTSAVSLSRDARLNGWWRFTGGRTSKIHSEPTGGDGSQLYVIRVVAVNVLLSCQPLKALLSHTKAVALLLPIVIYAQYGGTHTSSSMLIHNMEPHWASCASIYAVATPSSFLGKHKEKHPAAWRMATNT